MDNRINTNVWLTATILLLLASGFINVLLASKVARLENAITLLKAESSIKEGAKVLPISVRDLSGKAVVISYDVSPLPTLLYIFKPSCGWCRRNEENINALAKQGNGKVRVISLSLSSEQLSEYIKDWGPALPVYTEPASATIAAYKLGGTPNSLLIAPDGKVLKIWTGAYTGEIQRQIEDYFKVTLPGLKKLRVNIFVREKSKSKARNNP